jgi:hypothetical protein
VDRGKSQLIRRLLPLIPVITGATVLIIGRGVDSMTLSIAGGVVCVLGLAYDMLS